MLFGIQWSAYADVLLHGVLTTLEFTVSGFLCAAGVGFLVAVARVSPIWPLRRLAEAYTELLKNVPMLTVMFVIYFGLGESHIKLSSFEAGTISLAASYGAYLSEIFRAALQGVSRHQREAAQAIGLGRLDTLRYVVIPQAARLALPGTGTMLVDLLKATSLLITIGGNELMTQAQLIASDTFRPLPVYVVIGLIYFVLCFPLSRLVLRLEHALQAGTPLTPARRQLFRTVRRKMGAFSTIGG